MKKERIQKVLSSLGVGSRRFIEECIKEGRIKVNGEMAILGKQITSRDEVLFDGKKIILEAELFSLDGKQRFHVKLSKHLKLAGELGMEVGEILKKQSNNSHKK